MPRHASCFAHSAMHKRISRRARALAFILLPAALVGLAVLRRTPELLERTYDRVNVLHTTAGAGISQDRFLQVCAAIQVLVIAAAVLASVAAARRKSLAVSVGTLCLFATIYVDSSTRSITLLGDRLYVNLCDDAFISMRYARNFASGLGLVYNAGEHVEGYTNPLWTVLMSIPLALGVHEGAAPAFVLLVGGVLMLGCAFFARRLLARWRVPPALQVLALVAMLLDASLLDFALKGLETPLMAACAMAVTYGALRQREGTLLVGLVLLPTVRADGTLVGAFLLLWLMLEDWLSAQPEWMAFVRKHGLRVGAWVAASAAMVAWHYALYGQLAPNTYYLKVYSLRDRLPLGVAEYGFRGLLYYGVPTLFVLWAAITHVAARPAARMLLPASAMWMYGMYAGGDAFSHLRFVAPLMPVFWLGLARTAAVVWNSWVPVTRVVWWSVLALSIPAWNERGVVGSTWDTEGWIHDNLIAAKAMTANVPAGALVGVFFAGTVPYYAPQLRFLDLLGKADAQIGRQATFYGPVPGHNKFDFAYAYDVRKPDITFSALSCDGVAAFLEKSEDAQHDVIVRLKPSDYKAPWYQALDHTFRDLYVPTRVDARLDGAPVGHTLGCWYVRRGSGLPVVWRLRNY